MYFSKYVKAGREGLAGPDDLTLASYEDQRQDIAVGIKANNTEHPAHVVRADLMRRLKHSRHTAEPLWGGGGGVRASSADRSRVPMN